MQTLQNETVTVVKEGEHLRIVGKGDWTIPHLSLISRTLESLPKEGNILWDLGDVGEIDSAGVALVQLYDQAYQKAGRKSRFKRINTTHERLKSLLYHRPISPPSPPSKRNFFYQAGEQTHLGLKEALAFVAFMGQTFVMLLHLVRHPSQIRWDSIASHIRDTGLTALPIIALSAFLIGVVVAYQSIVQLQKFGADIFIVETISISLTRELAPLIAAIIVAGRSGSSFTAQIGAMKITQEIDAMRTMGFDPFVFLVWPRIIALMLVLPLLIFFADMVGIFGGMVIAYTQSNLSFSEFIHRLQNVLALKHFVIGIAKGPFFAFLIALAGIFRGFAVSSNTESIGHNTTRSVVSAIFLVIACDALFSIILTELRL